MNLNQRESIFHHASNVAVKGEISTGNGDVMLCVMMVTSFMCISLDEIVPFHTDILR